MWESYNKQIERTKQAFIKSNGNILSFFHYDPRAHLQNWQGPFNRNIVHTAKPMNFPRNLPAIGIKMYSALGWRPYDKNLNFAWDEYFSLCENKQIPITGHGSRGGMTTHDILRYYEIEFPQNANAPDTFKQSWFTDHFVSPYAWEPVLQKFPNLYLCLAHFGGDTFWDKEVDPLCNMFWEDLDDLDSKNWIAGFLHLIKSYPNFYVDISYFLFKRPMTEHFKKALRYDPKVKEHILFGTDWWMFTMENKYKKNNGYLKYVENMYELIEALDDKNFLKDIGLYDIHELLAYFMCINPLRFLQIKKLMPKLKTIFDSVNVAPQSGNHFEPTDWIYDVPEKINRFYK